MTPTPERSLGPLVEHFKSELDGLESAFGTCQSHAAIDSYKVPYVPSLDGCLISMWDAWNRYLRSLTLASVGGRTVGLSGMLYEPELVLSESEVIAALRREQKGKAYRLLGGEPYWYNAKHLGDILAVLQAPNSEQILGALSASSISMGEFTVSNPLDTIRVCRNFVAHKNDHLLSDVSRIGDSPFAGLAHLMSQKRRGLEVYREWADCLRVLSEIAAD